MLLSVLSGVIYTFVFVFNGGMIAILKLCFMEMNNVNKGLGLQFVKDFPAKFISWLYIVTSKLY